MSMPVARAADSISSQERTPRLAQLHRPRKLSRPAPPRDRTRPHYGPDRPPLTMHDVLSATGTPSPSVGYQRRASPRTSAAVAERAWWSAWSSSSSSAARSARYFVRVAVALAGVLVRVGVTVTR
jgi:hypothetical protein